ncbi:hypothetical protein ABZ958_37275 [Streptomyces sp. NPDC046237]|uniref:hypothetical protein n=1 Tax=Streptomyces sp. NPDC046237 TaxID=3154914 RepID=UPI0033D20F58
MAGRIARMTDKQVAASLAMSDEEIKTKAQPTRTPQYAPGTDPTPVILWDHVAPRWV